MIDTGGIENSGIHSLLPELCTTSVKEMTILCKMQIFMQVSFEPFTNLTPPLSNSTRSLYDSDVVYHYIHGRRYCKDYFMPNDEVEQTRLQMLGEVYYEVLGKRLTTVPLVNPTKVLDIGAGTGEWAMAMGDEYPDAEIIGTDIARIQPTATPLNVFFEIEDAEEETGWTWSENEFDLVHFRYMKGVRFAQIFHHLSLSLSRIKLQKSKY